MENTAMAPEENELKSIDIKNWVTKSNELIESTYKLSLQEQRILLVMASKVQPTDETLKTYRFRARDFIEIIGNKKGTGFYSYLKDIVNGLQSKVLTLKKDGKQRNYSWVITSIYEENEGYIQLQFHPELKGFFLRLKEKFTSYQLENVVRLSSVYSIRIYELLKQYEKLKKRKLTIEELRHYLAIEPLKYKQYGHFKSKVLLVAQNEINKKTDIKFEFAEFKTGRKVTAVEFIINGKINKETEAIPELTGKEPAIESTEDCLDIPKEENPIKSQMTHLGVSPKKIDEILNNYSEEHILRNIHYVQLQMEKRTIERPGPYLVSSIIENYGKDIVLDAEINDEAFEEHSKDMIVREFIKTIKPSKKSKEILPAWFIEDGAIKLFKKYMSENEAYKLWKEKKLDIIKEYETARNKIPFGSW